MGIFRRKKNTSQPAHEPSAGVELSATQVAYLAHEQGDFKKAILWYEKAANEGDAEAMSNLGTLLIQQERPDEAREWFQRAADAGVTAAMLNLGLLYSMQDDLKSAKVWWNKARSAGDPGADDFLHRLPQRANQLAQMGQLARDGGDTEKARALWKSAAGADDTDAIRSLGVLAYEAGDYPEAMDYWARAISLGDKDAKKLHALLADGMEKGYTDILKGSD